MSGYVLDDTLLRAFAQGNAHVTQLIASLDAREVRMAVPANVLAVAQAGLPDDDCETLCAVVERLAHVLLDDLSDLEQITALSHVIGWIGIRQDIAAAHAATVANHLDWPVLTLDVTRWTPIQEKLPWQIPLVQLSEPR